MKYAIGLMIVLFAASSLMAAENTTLTFDQPQMAGISGLRELWDTPVVVAEDGASQVVEKHVFGTGPSAIWLPEKRDGGARPGAAAFDAVHRSLLVRFPGAAEKLAALIRQGYEIEKAELVLPFLAAEFWPEGMNDPAGMSFLGEEWARNAPRWHAVAWALRRPWFADPRQGPTFNAFANGAGYWKRFGAQDETQDRFPQRFGPAEVSSANTEGRLDVTPLLRDAAFGNTIAARLRVLEDQGFIVRKEEVYDFAYWHGFYEWGTGTGARGILVKTPRLIVTLAKTAKPADVGELRPAPTLDELTARKVGRPSAVMPGAEQIRAWAEKFGFRRQPWMTDWQWERVRELAQMGTTWDFPATPEAYAKWIDGQLGRPPRSWYGFDAAEVAQTYLRFADTLPVPVKAHWQLYWWSWLYPDRDHKDLVHAVTQADKGREYYQRTGDWRGNASLYRTYCWNMGTMNFNHWASAGTLLGGAIINSPVAIADGRHGVEYWPLRTWCWFDGSTQESIDHYYFAITLGSQKVFSDFGPSRLDRLMGKSMLAKSIDELASCFHPNLRRFTAVSGRTGIAYMLGIQDGLQAIMHTLSRTGAYTDAGKRSVTAPNVSNMPVLGHNLSPALVAQGTLDGPWAPEWQANVIDNKPLPFEITVGYKMWGGFAKTPLVKRSYLGRHYGLASLDVASGNETVPVMAQWVRRDAKAASMTDLGTLIMRPGINRTEMLDSIWHGGQNRNPNGSVGTQGSTMATLQHRNKAIVLASPLPKLDYPHGRPMPDDVRSVQMTIGLFHFEPQTPWEIFIDGRAVRQLPAAAKFGQRIVLHDGVTYVGIIPIRPPDFERDAEVVLADDGVMTEMQGGGKTREALRINAYLMKLAEPMEKTDANFTKLDRAWMGYVLEVGDVTEFTDVAAFQKHLASTKLTVRWDEAATTAHVRYASARDILECGYRTDYGGDWNTRRPTNECFPYRRVNGALPFLPEGFDRDTTLAQRGRTGRLEKNGAALTCEPGKLAYLQTEPKSGTFVGWNPLPDAVADWSLTLPGGWKFRANGKVGLLCVTARPKENSVAIDYGGTADGGQLATELLLSGAEAAPKAVINDRPAAELEQREVGGEKLWVLPLDAPDGK